jgi:hypothetical protein
MSCCVLFRTLINLKFFAFNLMESLPPIVIKTIILFAFIAFRELIDFCLA